MSTIPDYPNLDVEKVQSDLNTEFLSLKSGYDTAKTRRMKAYREYKFQQYGNEKDGQSKIVDSSIWDAVEWYVPTMIQPFMETENFLKIVPEEANLQSLIRSQVHRELLNYQIRKRTNFYELLHDLIKGMLIQNECYLKVSWQKADKANGEPVSRPILTACPASQIRYDWTIRNFEESHVVTQEEDLTKSEILDLMEGAEGLIKDRFDKVLSTPGGMLKTARLRDEPVDQPNWVGEDTEKGNDDQSLYLRREQWTTYSLKGDGRTIPVMSVFINDTLVQMVKNPTPINRPPFFRGQCVRDVLGNPAISIAEILSDIQKFKTGILRMTSDNLNAQLNGMYEFDQNNVDDVGVQLLQRAPRGSRLPIPVNRMGSINPLPVAPIAQHAFTTWEMLDVAKENRSGFTRYSQGQDSSSLNQTATGIVAITQRSEMRMWEMTMRFAETLLKPLARALIAYNQERLTQQDIELQFGSPEYRYHNGEETVVIPEKKAGDWVTLSKKDLGGHFSLVVDIDIGADKQQKIDNYLAWAQYFGGLAGQGIPPEAITLVGLETARLMGIKQVEALVKKEVKTIGGGGVSVPVGAGPSGSVQGDPSGEAAIGPEVQGAEAEPGFPGADTGGIPPEFA